MANECINYITVKGDKDLVQLFADSYLKKDEQGDYVLDFNIIAPIPDDCENDYEFRIKNWGNKWDGTHGQVTFWTDDEIFIDVTTAWSPCEPITHKLIELCPALYFYHEYYEGGEGYIGWIEHLEDDPPDEYTDVCYYSYSDPHGYWFNVFDKEYEDFTWLSEYIDDMVADGELDEEQAYGLQEMIDNDTPLEILIAACIDDEVLL